MGFTVVQARGTSFERGRAIGRGLGEAIHDSLGFGARSLDHVLGPYVAASEAAVPHLVEQLRGMADGAEQPFAMVMAANAFEEITNGNRAHLPGPSEDEDPRHLEHAPSAGERAAGS